MATARLRPGGSPVCSHAELHVQRAHLNRLQLCQETTPPASLTVGAAMLRLHRTTAIPDNRNRAGRHPPASRSVIDQACSLDRRQSTFRLVSDVNGHWWTRTSASSAYARNC